MPALPIYAWAAAGAVLLAIVLGARAAGAEPELEDGGAQPEGPPPLLKEGSSGPWVTFLQKKLGIGTSGIFDAATKAAVVAFQAAHGLDPDGKVGAMTWGKLGVSAAAPPAPGGGAPKPAPPSTPAPPATPTVANPFGLSAMVVDREAQILAHVAQGNHEHQWYPLDYTTPDGHQVHLEVSRRAFALADDAGHRLMVSMTFNGAQKLADMIGGAMLTSRISDEIWKAAGSKPTPTNQSWNTDSPVTGGKTDRMYEQSDKVNAKVLASGAGAGLVGNEGKDWILTRRYWGQATAGKHPQPAGTDKPAGVSGSKHNAANFGLYAKGGSMSDGGLDVLQPNGLAHDRGNAGGFVDYSQVARFVRQGSLTIDGVPWDYAAALADPSVSSYIQDEGGTIPAARHPDL